MFLGVLVAWVIPDVPKNISEQIQREKTLLVDVFMKEEKEKLQLIHSLFSKETGNLKLRSPEPRKITPTISQPQAPLPNVTQLDDAPAASRPRTRARAASFSQFTRQDSVSPHRDLGAQTAV